MAMAISLKCVLCHKSIKSQDQSCIALKETWHKECFRCSVCKVQLSDVFYSRKKKLFCQQHYLARYTHSCHRCHKKVSGLVMLAGDISFHTECFCCIKCRKLISHRDDYVFEERTYLYCSSCYKNDVVRYIKFKKFKSFQRNAIHQVHIPASDIKEKKLLFSVTDVLKDGLISELEKKLSCSKRRGSNVSVISHDDNDPSALSTGDKVLEINGIPIFDSNIHQFTKLFENVNVSQNISVMVERTRNEVITSIPAQVAPMDSGPKSADLEKLRRNKNFFNFAVFHRTWSNPTEIKRKAAMKGKRPLPPKRAITLDQLPEEDQLKLSMPIKKISQPQKKTLYKSKSLNDIKNLSLDEERFFTAKEFRKAVSPLHRAQSFRPELASSSNQIFTPTDIIFGEVVGRGFFGEVVKVSHKITGDEMVIKKLREFDLEAEEQLLKEAQLLKTLKHPNVLRFIGIMYKDKLVHILLEYIPEGSLRKLLKHVYIELSWKQKVELIKDIASGMEYLHSENVWHRDLKSKNVLIKTMENGRKRAIVADFGLASVMHQFGSFFVTHSKPVNGALSPGIKYPISPRKRKTVVGSPFWMAPEILCGDEYDETVDIFSFGIVMCEISGRVKADPDELPRTQDFGLDSKGFLKKFPETPLHVINLASACCSMKPEERPPFRCSEKWLQAFLAESMFNIPLPNTINFLVEPKPPCLKNQQQETDGK